MLARIVRTATIAFAFIGEGGERIAFEPEAGDVAVKALRSACRLEQQQVEQSWRRDGSENDLCWDGGLVCETRVEVILHDEYVQVGDGRPEQIARRFDHLALHSDGCESESPLEGARTVVTWGDETGDYWIGFDARDRHLDASLLERLPSSLDLHPWVPGRRVQVGDSWPADGAGLRDFLTLDRMPFDEQELCAPDLGMLPLDGELRATAVEVFTRDGTNLAKLEVRGNLESEERLETWEEADPFGFGFAMEALVGRSVEGCYQVEGEVLWNLDAGRWEELRLGVEVRFEVTETITGEELELETRTAWTGCITLEGRIPGD